MRVGNDTIGREKDVEMEVRSNKKSHLPWMQIVYI